MSNKPTVLIIGSGWGVSIQIPCFTHAGWQVVGVVAKSQSHVEAVEARTKSITFYTSLEAALQAHPHLDLVSITSPPASHEIEAITVLKANPRILLSEKPFALNSGEALRMVEAAKSSTSIALVDHELRTLKATITTRACVSNASFGEIRSVSLIHYGPLAVKPFWNWWSVKKLGGGLLNALGSHFIDLVQHVTNSRFDNVSCSLATSIKHKEDPNTKEMKLVDSDDFCSLIADATTLATKHQFPVSLVISGNAAILRKTLIINGSNQAVELDLDHLSVTLYTSHPQRKAEKVVDSDDYTDSEIEKLSLGKNGFTAGTVLIARKLLDVVQGRASLQDDELASFEDGLKIQKVLDAAFASYEEGRRVDIRY